MATPPRPEDDSPLHPPAGADPARPGRRRFALLGAVALSPVAPSAGAASRAAPADPRARLRTAGWVLRPEDR